MKHVVNEIDRRWIRDGLGLGLPLLWMVGATAALLAFWDRLPEPLASHWSLRGEPSNAMPRFAFLLLLLGMSSFASVASFVATRRFPARPGEIVPQLQSAAFVGWMAVATGNGIVALNLDAPNWRAAAHLPVWAVALALGLIAIAAHAVRYLAQTLEVLPAHTARSQPSLGLQPQEQAVWSRSYQSRSLQLVAAAVAVASVHAAMGSQWGSALVGVIATGVTILLSGVSVRVDHRGVEVRFGPLRWPKKSIALAKIRTAKVIEVEPLAWGGWGYRRRKGATAIVLRRGQGLEIEEHDHHRTIVTIDDSRTAAGLINDLVARDGSHG